MDGPSPVAQQNDILIVDDDPNSLKLLKRLLQAEGYQVRTAKSAERAVENISQALPDLILLDTTISNLDSFAFCQWLKAKPDYKDIQVIFISCLTERDDRVRVFEAEGVDYIIKPFSSQELLARVKTHLHLRKLQRQLNWQNQELHRSQAALQESEARYRTICQLVSDHVYSCQITAEGEIVNEWSTAKLGGLTGLDLENLNGVESEELSWIYQEDLPIFEDFIENLLSHHQPGTLEYRIITPQGDIRWIRDRILPERDENEQRVVRILGAVEDITERKQAELDLRTTTSRLSILIASLQAGVLVEDEQRRIVLVNQEFCNYFGLPVPPQVLIGADCSQAAEQNKHLFVDPEIFVKRIDQILTQQQVVVGEELQMRDGRTLERDYIPILSPEHRYQGHLWQYRDISLRKRDEAKLLQREAYLEALVEVQLQLLMFEGDRQKIYQKILEPLGQAADASRVYVFENHSTPEGELLTSQRAEWCAEGIKPKIDNANLQNVSLANALDGWFTPLLKGEPILGFMAELPQAARQLLELQEFRSILLVPIMIQDSFFGFIGFDDCKSDRTWDASEVRFLWGAATSLALALEHNHSKQSLRESESRFRSLVDNIPGVIYRCLNNRSWTMLYLSERIWEVSGYRAEEFIHDRVRSFISIVHPEDVDRVLRISEQSLIERQAYMMEYRIIRADGEIRWVYECGRDVFDLQGNVLWADGAIFDISDRKAAEVQLKSSLQEKTALLQEVHHRVKNNLQVISSLLRLQSQRVNDPQVKTTLEDSQNRVMAMALVHQNLYQSDDFAQVNLAVYIHSLATHLFSVFAIERSRIDLQIEVDEQVAIPLDKAVPCGLILNELMTNALKHGFQWGRRSGKIVVTISTSPSCLTLKVSNDGEPLPQDFNPESSRSMGLKLVKVLVEQLFATFKAEQQENTVFSLTFDPQRQ
uniref:histidine kinase n=1 Tax=Cyanothece sp. (strain PCC 7425 / ATCC 29141) TaxID=395961 RepID=B8HXU9_CYAP4